MSGKPIKVLHLTSVESGNYYLNNLFDHLDPEEIALSAATFGVDRGFASELKNRGAEAVALDCLRGHHYIWALKKTHEVLVQQRPDIIHTHLFTPSLVGIALAKLHRLSAIVTRHHSDAVHRIQNRLKRTVYLLLERWINRSAAHIIAPSRTVYDILTGLEGVPISKVSLIPYGQTTARYETVSSDAVASVRRKLNMDGVHAIVCVSRLHQEKGHPYLFEAFAKLVEEGINSRIYLVGEGRDKESLQSLAQNLGIDDRVEFLGWRDDALTIIAAADLVVHPSLHEALPSAVIESLMLERPLVATDVSGVPDIVGDNEYGLIVPPADSAALYRAINNTISDLEGATRRAKGGRQFLLRYMDAGRVAGEYTACYRKVGGGMRGSSGISSGRQTVTS